MIKNYALALIPVIFSISCAQPQAASPQAANSNQVVIGQEAEGEASAKVQVSAETEADAQAVVELFLDDNTEPAAPVVKVPGAAVNIDAIVEARAKAAATVLIARFDKDKSGGVSLEEFLSIAQSSPIEKVLKIEKTPEQIEEIRKVLTEKFNKIAAGGEITAEKFEAAAKARFADLKKKVEEKVKEVRELVVNTLDKAMIPKIDANGDGKVESAEIEAFKTAIINFRREQSALNIEEIKKKIESIIAAGKAGGMKPGAQAEGRTGISVKIGG